MDLFASCMSTNTVLSVHVTKTIGYRIKNITVLNLGVSVYVCVCV